MTSITTFFSFIPFLTVVLLTINLVFAPHNPYQEKNSTFECGFHSFLNQNRSPFNIVFFIFAILFLLFDLEILLVYPFVTSFYTNEIYGLNILLEFFFALILGFVFELGKGALKIDSKQYSKIKINIRKFIKIIKKLDNPHNNNTTMQSSLLSILSVKQFNKFTLTGLTLSRPASSNSGSNKKRKLDEDYMSDSSQSSNKKAKFDNVETQQEVLASSSNVQTNVQETSSQDSVTPASVPTTVTTAASTTVPASADTIAPTTATANAETTAPVTEQDTEQSTEDNTEHNTEGADTQTTDYNNPGYDNTDDNDNDSYNGSDSTESSGFGENWEDDALAALAARNPVIGQERNVNEYFRRTEYEQAEQASILLGLWRGSFPQGDDRRRAWDDLRDHQMRVAAEFAELNQLSANARAVGASQSRSADEQSLYTEYLTKSDETRRSIIMANLDRVGELGEALNMGRIPTDPVFTMLLDVFNNAPVTGLNENFVYNPGNSESEDSSNSSNDDSNSNSNNSSNNGPNDGPNNGPNNGPSDEPGGTGGTAVNSNSSVNSNENSNSNSNANDNASSNSSFNLNGNNNENANFHKYLLIFLEALQFVADIINNFYMF